MGCVDAIGSTCEQHPDLTLQRHRRSDCPIAIEPSPARLFFLLENWIKATEFREGEPRFGTSIAHCGVAIGARATQSTEIVLPPMTFLILQLIIGG
jgi:hypothetical protein